MLMEQSVVRQQLTEASSSLEQRTAYRRSTSSTTNDASGDLEPSSHRWRGSMPIQRRRGVGRGTKAEV